MTDDRRRMTRHRAEQLLVDAARADAPPSGARERALASLGISASAALAGARAAAAQGSATEVGIASKAGFSTLAKAIALGAVAGGVGMAIVTSRSSGQRPTIAFSAKPGAVQARSVTTVPLVPSQVGAIPAASAPAARRKPLATSAGAASVAPAAAPSVEVAPPVVLAEQAAAERILLDGARKALAAGRASTAAKALAEYERRFGFGILGDEERVLKVEVLLALGRRAEAIDVGQRYLAERPRGTQAATVQRLLASDQNSKDRP